MGAVVINFNSSVSTSPDISTSGLVTATLQLQLPVSFLEVGTIVPFKRSTPKIMDSSWSFVADMPKSRDIAEGRAPFPVDGNWCRNSVSQCGLRVK